MKMLTVESVMSLEPCYTRSRVVQLFGNRSEVAIVDALLCQDVPYNDRVWLARKLFSDEKTLWVAWAIACASSVLHHYETKYPNDDRPRNAIAAAKAGENLASARTGAIQALHAAYYAAYAAYYAADAAAYAACNAADGAAADAADAAVSAADAAAAAAAADARSVARESNLKLLCDLITARE